MNNWDEIYNELGYRGKYPNRELVDYVSYIFPEPSKDIIKILEVGCGPGANIWFLSREGFDAYGIDGSETAIRLCRERLQNDHLAADVRVGDMCALPYPDSYFDFVADVASIQHNTPENIKRIISEIHRVLKPQGNVFSWARSDKDSLYGKGIEKINVTHFFTLKELNEFWQNFSIGIEHTYRTENGREIAHYIVTGIKS